MTDAEHDAILAAIRDQLTHPLQVGTNHPPRQENPAMNERNIEPITDRRLSLMRAMAKDDTGWHWGKADIEEMIARIDQAESAVERVKALHYEAEGIHDHTVCAHVRCLDYSLDQSRWPCPTIRALEGADQ